MSTTTTPTAPNIPKVIWQSWKTTDLPNNGLKQASDVVRTLNPEYKYMLYGDKECRDLLLQHFGPRYAAAFDVLRPGAFRSDMWRYAVLYLYGGVYMDLDMVPLVPLRDFLSDDDRLVTVAEVPNFFVNDCGVYQAFIACEPRHPALLQALEMCLQNIEKRKTGEAERYSITGPVVMAIAMNRFWGRDNDISAIRSGVYPGGVRLYQNQNGYVYDTVGRRSLIKNKWDGYDRGSEDYEVGPYYKDTHAHAQPSTVEKFTMDTSGNGNGNGYLFTGVCILLAIAALLLVYILY